MTEKKKQQYLTSVLMAVAATLIVVLASAGGILNSIENMAEDYLYQKQGMIPDNIKIIAIDEKTLDRLGPYNQWDRTCFAELLGILNSGEDTAPRVIGMDFIFSGSNDTQADKALVENAGKYKNVVFATALNFDRYTYKDDNGKYYSVQYISGEEKPFNELAQVVELGFTNPVFDSDSFVRHTYTRLSSDYRGEASTYEAFAYKIASMLGKEMDYDTQVEIAFTGKPGEFEHISMADVLDGKVPEGYFKDCIVLVGAFEEAMMDAYRVPIDYSREMYGVEVQANYINGFLNNKIMHQVDFRLQLFITGMIVLLYALFAFHTRVRYNVLAMTGTIVAYEASAVVLYGCSMYKLNLLDVPVGVVFSFWISLLYRYLEMQKNRVREMRETLFSMAEAMAEAIEGRTPYNANHTKNVAVRCMEMLDFINEKHHKKETDLYFTKEDKYQLYLAAMLHDVGKMDVPLEVMDKATKLGDREEKLRDRLLMISLRIEIDALNGRMDRDVADEKIAGIRAFLDSLGAFNCGRPLKEEEWQFVNEMSENVYVGNDGEKIPYLTKEEIDDLHIKAGTLSENERMVMQSHVVYTDKILSHVKFGKQFHNVRTMAANHHELLNGKGYPNGIGGREIDVMTRILTIMDIYDSLIADDRPYKKPKPVKVAFDILEEEASFGKVDPELLKFAKELYLKEEEQV